MRDEASDGRVLAAPAKRMNWLVYIIRCSDGSLYTGITTDLERRLAQHRAQRGAKYFRGRVPEHVVYLEHGHDRSSASRREAAIKRLSPSEKRRLVAVHAAGATDNGRNQCGP